MARLCFASACILLSAAVALAGEDGDRGRRAEAGDGGPGEELYIGFGQGTTGTRSMHKTLCSHGIPSCHWNECCPEGVEPQMERAHELLPFLYLTAMNCAKFQDQRIHADCSGVTSPAERRGFDLGVWRNREQCLRSHSRCCPKYAETMDVLDKVGCRLDAWAAALKAALRDVFASGLKGFTDVPYAGLLKAIKRLIGKRPVRAILTTRDPVKWAKRRLRSHSHALVCRSPAAGDSAIDDLLGCAEQALRGGASDLAIADAFTTLDELKPAAAEDALRLFQENQAAALARTPWDVLLVDYFRGAVNEQEVGRNKLAAAIAFFLDGSA